VVSVSYCGMKSAKPQTVILIVEDEAIIRMSSVATLEDAGFGIVEAGSAAEALHLLLKHEEISILMTDVRLAGELDGLELVSTVRRLHPAIRSLVVSGNSSKREARDAGALGFLAKPFMAHSLVLAVQDLIQGTGAPLGHAA
jgi:DNA-binding NtrC family response regulator